VRGGGQIQCLEKYLIDIPKHENPRLWVDKGLANLRPYKLARPGRADWQVDTSSSLGAGFSDYPGAIIAIALVIKL
jgi:hypothetical protein